MNHTTHDLRVTDSDIQATFLSLQATVEELVREHSYVTVYDEYTPQSFVENGKKLVDKIVAIIKRVFDWVVGLFSNRSNSLKKTKQELDSSIKAAKKEAKEVKTPPPPPPPPQKTDVEKYIELLQKWGYAIDGKWAPIRLFNESNNVLSQLQSQMDKNREYLAKYSKVLSDADSQAVDFDPTDHHFDKLQKKFTDFYAILIPLNKSGEGGRYELHPPVVPRRRDLSKRAFNENTIHDLPDRAFVLEAAECASTTMAHALQDMVHHENACKQNLDDFRQLVKQREQSHRFNLALERACSFTIKTIRATLQNLGVVLDVINDTSKLTTALLKIMTPETPKGESTMDHQAYQSQHWSTLLGTSSGDATMSSDFEAQDLEQTFLSLQQSLDDAIANQQYQTNYGDYTPQGLVQKGRELGKKFWDWLCAIFQKFWNFITGKSKRVEKARDELKKTIDESKKQHTDTGPKPQDSGSSAAPQKDSGVSKSLKEDPRYKKQLDILKTRGYLVDGHVDFSKNIDIAFNLLKTLHDSTNEVVEALTKLDFTKTSSTDEFLSSAGVDASFVEKQYARWPKKITDFYHLEDETEAYARGMGDLGVGGSINKRYGYNVRPYLTLENTREKAFDDYPLGKFLASFDFSNAAQLLDKSGRVLALLRDLEARIDKTTKTLTGTRRRMLDAGRFDKEAAVRIVNLVGYVRCLASDPLRIAVEVCEDTLIAAKDTINHISAIAFNSLGSGANNSHPDHQSFPRNSTMYTLADAIQAQVTQLAFEEAGIDPNTPVCDIELASEAVADSTIEDRNDIEETEQHRAQLDQDQYHVEECLDNADGQTNAIVTLESLSDNLAEASRRGELTPVVVHFAKGTVSSALSAMNVSRTHSADVIPDMLAYGGSYDEVTMLGVLNTISNTMFGAWESVVVAINRRLGTQRKLIKSLTTRHAKLLVAAKEFKGNEQTGDILSATQENINLAERLFVGPADNRTEVITDRFKTMVKMQENFVRNSVPHMDKLAEELLSLADHSVDTIDGRFVKTLGSIFSGFPKQNSHVDPLTKDVVVEIPPMFGNIGYQVTLPPQSAGNLTPAEFAKLAMSIGMDYHHNAAPAQATKSQWHHFVLKGLGTREVSTLLDLVGNTLHHSEEVEQVFAKQSNVGSMLLQHAKRTLGTSNGVAGTRGFVRSIMRLWSNVVSVFGFLNGAVLDVVSDILLYVGKSMSKWEFFKSRGVGDVLSEVGSQIKTELGSIVAARLVGGMIDTGHVSKVSPGSFSQGVGVAIGARNLLGIYQHGRNIYRRHTWDNHARSMMGGLPANT